MSTLTLPADPPRFRPSMQTRLEDDIAAARAAAGPQPDEAGILGRTMFDLPSSEDGTVTVLLARENLPIAPAQSLVRILSRGDDRRYVGVVTAGPFAEPDSLRGDSAILQTLATRGGDYLPAFHGRVQVALLGEELPDGTLTPHRLRPLPHSPVFGLTDEESATLLHVGGDLRLGLAVGHENLVVGVPSASKAVLPRHTAILGTTGSGKSTTVSNLIARAQAAGLAVVLLDVEGEYALLNQPTQDPRMRSGLAQLGLPAAGIPAERMTLYHLVGRDCAAPDHPCRRPFSLQLARLSPYTIMEILDLSDAQQERFLKAYDLACELLRELGVFPAAGKPEQERLAMELDEFERGYPRLTLPLLLDVVAACLRKVDRSGGAAAKKEPEEMLNGWRPAYPLLKTDKGVEVLQRRLHTACLPGHPVSWRALLGRLGRLNRLKVFFDEADGVRPLSFKQLLQPGQVSLIDLSDSGMSEMNNLVIADLLRGLQSAQDEAYQEYERTCACGAAPAAPPRLLVIIEEAHEFLAAERVDKLSFVFEQVAKIAKRGRKRWLGLVFVTQLPQHLPRQVLSLCNNFVLHKLTDPQVVNALRHTVTGLDEGLWRRLPGLAPGQAIVSFGHLARPLLVSIDPTGARLRLVD